MGGLIAVVDWSGSRGEEWARASAARARVATARPLTQAADVREGVAGALAASDGGIASVGALTVAADLRLDGEEDLARLLDAPGARGAELVLRAFARWRERFAARLRGDFAVVVVDRESGVVCAARDALGVKPLAFRRLGSAVAFASDPAALAAIEAAEVDADLVGRYLEGQSDESPTQTFFRGVARVAPGHVVVATDRGEKILRFWTPGTDTRAGTREDTLAELRARILAAVADRLREPNVLVHVSGGVDSGSIACAAGALGSTHARLVSARFAEADESAYVAAIARRVRLPIEVIDARPTCDLDDPLDASSPARYALAAMSTGLAAVATRVGARATLSGVGGDELFFERGVFRDLAAHGRIRALLREATLAERYSTRGARFYVMDALRALPPSFARRAAAFFRRVRRSPRRSAGPRPPWLRERAREPEPARAVPDADDPLRWPSHVQRTTWSWLTSGRLAATLEAEDRAAARDGLSMRYPLLDLRVVEHVLATPWEERIPSGRMKALLRDALADELPREVRERVGVTVFDDAIAAAIARKAPILRDVLERGPWRADPWVDRREARALLARLDLGAPPDAATAIAVWDIAMLELWLRSR